MKNPRQILLNAEMEQARAKKTGCAVKSPAYARGDAVNMFINNNSIDMQRARNLRSGHYKTMEWRPLRNAAQQASPRREAPDGIGSTRGNHCKQGLKAKSSSVYSGANATNGPAYMTLNSNAYLTFAD